MKSATNITTAHKSAFDALRDDTFGNVALFSCFVDGEPASAIVALTPGESTDDDVLITPLFVSVTDKMALTDHDGRAA